jgi:dipeptidyl aminopeptidase/acylaminoacyl peptidase
MGTKQIGSFGSWKSPITSDLVVQGAIVPTQIALDGDDVYWVEMRPAEGGRYVIVRRTPDGELTDVTPPPFNARTRVHEYGGGALVVSEGTLFFSNFSDQRLYRVDPGKAPRAITPEAPLRYADGVMDARRNRLICVREDHAQSDQNAVNAIAAVPVSGRGGRVLVSGNDFYSSPRISSDGSRLAWLTWNHSNMPWDGTELWVGEFRSDGTVGRKYRVAGSPAGKAGGESESVLQPEWSPDGVLYFVSDRSGWWNLYRLNNSRIEPLWETDAEFAAPPWAFRKNSYAFESPTQIVCAFTRKGVWNLAVLDTTSRRAETIDVPYQSIAGVEAVRGRAAFVAGSPTETSSVVMIDLATRRCETLRRSSDVSIDSGYLSVPEAIEFPTERGLTAHAFYYAPKNRDFEAPPDEKPPLLVISHGGPTAATDTTLRLTTQYWTSRGFAVLDVNYGGSTGYGRAYRERLNGQWGVVDVDDCANGARFLVERGLADGSRLAIRGSSAGGYTTLCALTFRRVFRAGASHFGVSDLEALVKETHKFESRYLDRLIGPHPARRDLYIERSPIHHVEQLSCPVIFFQGLEDKIVPPDQAQMMADALRSKGVPVAYVAFEGEQHGFRKAENIKRSLDAELYFYSRVFNFAPAESIGPVQIENLPQAGAPSPR